MNLNLYIKLNNKMETFSEFTLANYVPNNHYVKGALSGMFGIILSHPIDTIKTQRQALPVQLTNQSIPKSSMKFNLITLYRGVTSPLLGVGFEKALVFGTYSELKKRNFPIPISGAVSGFLAACIVTPYERIKILKQTKQSVALKDIIKPSFLFKGLSATWTREIPGFAIYFSVYEGLKNHFYVKQHKDITIMSSFVFGGLAGSSAWLFIYPQDRIKTIIQSNSVNSVNSENVLKKSIREIIINTYKQGGIKQFYSGFTWAIYRAILLHSGTFCMMEILNS
jgi:solute carrier family 25 carnitine/acylcarnitine transporter 20/29